jgi:hypothetical protein
LVIAFIAILAACAHQSSYAEQVADRPMPQTEQERQEECGFLRSEIARQETLGQVGGTMATTPLMTVAVQAKARNNIATLESRAAEVQCTAAFSNVPVSSAPVSTKPNFDECFSHCRKYTDRTKEQCFDTCNK